jgi:3-oxoacyl-[acyl-carrier protein] reductase
MSQNFNLQNKLANKVALVTGGSRGIGAAIVRRLAGEGAIVVFTYIAAEERADALVKAIEAEGGKALAVKADSADSEALRQVIADAVQAFGRIDILVNNAGILLKDAIDDTTLADFDKITAVNVRAVFVAIKEAVQHMGSGGRIITIGSIVADRAGFPGIALYGMSKAAVAALTRGFARDLGPRGITINTVQPGPTDTEIVTDPSVKAFIQTLMPIGRLGLDSEVAALVAFLAGPESSFINGAALTIDGGFQA